MPVILRDTQQTAGVPSSRPRLPSESLIHSPWYPFRQKKGSTHANKQSRQSNGFE